MGSNANRLRRKWQDYSSANASDAERNFFDAFNVVFENTEYKIIAKPKDFSELYVGVDLAPEVKKAIYTPTNPVTRHGVRPDYAIRNTNTEKTIYVEVKRQDGWVEGKTRQAGRGNAHERSCKFFTPGLQDALRAKGNLDDSVLPFWVVFQGDIARDPCRVREITLWYKGCEGHYFFWRDPRDPEALIGHFEKFIEPVLK